MNLTSQQRPSLWLCDLGPLRPVAERFVRPNEHLHSLSFFLHNPTLRYADSICGELFERPRRHTNWSKFENDV